MEAKYQFGRDEIAQVLLQPNEVRYEYFVKRVSDWELVWSLKGVDGWVMSADETGNEIAVFWPFEDYAKLCANGAWQGTVPKSIDIEAFLSRWLPGLYKDRRRVGIFPNLLKQASVVDPMKLKEQIEAEREKFE
jgi:hypothetical protein